MNNYAITILISVLGSIQEDKQNIIRGQAKVQAEIEKFEYLGFDIISTIKILQDRENDIIEALKTLSKK